jgi:pyrimidine-specific ribonucleoside hydrolase
VSVIVDTDLAADDIVALAYLTSHPDVDLLAVTVTGTGEITCPRGADVARGLLAGAGLDDVPVACGSTAPLDGERVFPEPWRLAANNVYGLLIKSVTPPADGPDAVELLTETITSSPVPVTLLTLGPLTNVAAALATDPQLTTALERVVVMGGAVDVPGNVQPDGASEPLAAEWNLYIDPLASAAVIESGAPVTLVALDATNEVPVTEDVIERLAANDTTPATDQVLRLFESYPPPFLWDPLAAIAVTDPELVPGRQVEVEVVVEGADSGRTAARPGGTPVELSDPPDATAIIDHLLRILAGLGDDEHLAVPTTLPVLGELAVAFDGTECSYDGPTTLPAGAYRVEVAPGAEPYAVVVAPLLGETTLDEVLTWVAEHPEQEPPMVGETTFITPDAPESEVVLEPGRVGLVCGTEQNEIVPATEITVTG